MLAGFEGYLEMAVALDVPAADPGGGEETASPSPEGDGYPLVEAQLRDTQVMLQRTATAMADMVRVLRYNAGAPAGYPAETAKDPRRHGGTVRQPRRCRHDGGGGLDLVSKIRSV